MEFEFLKMGGKKDNISRRLSKPRTNNNSSSNLITITPHDLESSSPFSLSEMDYFGDDTVVTSQEQRRSRRKSRSKIRDYLYGSNDVSPPMSSSGEEPTSPSKRVSGGTVGAKRRLSRTESALMQLSNATSSTSRLSTSSNPTSPLRHDTEESLRIAEQIKEKAHTDSLTADQHVSSPADECNHVDAMFAPIRRKSLYTPGIATRSASDILRKPPPQNQQDSLSEADRNYYYNPSHSETSPLARLAALSISRDGASSPCSLNIPHLGGLQLGTLRVTNGAASPAPAKQPMTLSLPPTTSSKSHDESNTFPEVHDDRSKTMANRPLLCSPNALPTIAKNSSNPEEEQWSKKRNSTLDVGSKTPGDSSAMAEAYIAELSGSPFSRSASVRQPDNGNHDDEAVVAYESDWLRLAKCHNATCISLSDSCSMADTALKPDSGYESFESLDMKHCSTLNYERDWSNRQGPGFKIWGKVLSPHKDDDAPFEPPLTKQHSFTNIHSGCGITAEPRINSVNALEMLKTYKSPNTSSSPKLPRKLQKMRPKSQPPPLRPNIGASADELAESSIPRVPPLMAKKHSERLANFPLLEHTFPSSGHVTSRESPTPPEIVPIPIRFPSPAGRLETTSAGPSIKHMLYDFTKPTIKRDSSQVINQPPKEERDDSDSSDIIRSPTWSNFGRSKRKREQKKLVKRAEEERRLGKEEKDLARQLTQDKKSPEKHLRNDGPLESSRSRTSSRARGKSRERGLSQQEVDATIADFGTIAASLGGSPYDIATAMHPNAGIDAGGSHPHQMSSAMHRPRSIVRMESMASLDIPLSQNRTRTQSFGRRPPIQSGTTEDSPIKNHRPQTPFNGTPRLAMSAINIQTHGLDWAKNEQNNHNHPGQNVIPPGLQYTQLEPFRDCGDVPRKPPRPHSTIFPTPPVPALPSLLDIKQREADSSHLRPRSMVIGTSLDPSSTEEIRYATASHFRPEILDRRRTARPSTDESAIDGSDQSPDRDSAWEAQRQAWSQRRKSAGEALLNQQRNNESPVSLPLLPGPSPSPNPPATVQPSKIMQQNRNKKPPQLPSPFKRQAILTHSTSTHHIPAKNVDSSPLSSAGPNSNATRLSGRFEGGLQYGYEPGAGVGGSAGTRGASTDASRKSVVVSQDFGIDLSDVPVFIAATPK